MGFVSGTQNTLIKELDYLWVDEKKKKTVRGLQYKHEEIRPFG